MRLVLLGAPGSGKGTQAVALSKRFNVPHISTGEIFRRHLSQGTSLGKTAQGYMDAGKLVPDDVTEAMVAERLGEDDARPGFILDGFPRTLPQGNALLSILDQRGVKLTKAIYLAVDQDTLMQRLTGRRVCAQCGASYHLELRPPVQEGVCDHCAGPLEQREDDSPATAAKRLMVYEEQTAPLIGFFEEKGLLMKIDGDQPISDVTQIIVSRLGQAAI